MCLCCSVGFPCWAAKQDILLSKFCHHYHHSSVILSIRQSFTALIQKPSWKWNGKTVPVVPALTVLQFSSKGNFEIHHSKLMPNQNISLTHFVSCVHIWFASICCNVPFNGLPFIQYAVLLLPALLVSLSSTMWRDEGVYTHSSKLCASETHVTLIGLFTIVIKFFQSETNVWTVAMCTVVQCIQRFVVWGSKSVKCGLRCHANPEIFPRFWMI